MQNQYRPNNVSMLPMAVKNLLIINGLCYLANYTLATKMNVNINEFLGLYFYESSKFHWYQFFTHLFMHGSFGHILSNMFALWMFGTAIENYWGSKRFLIYYFITGFGAALLHTAVNWYEIAKLQDGINTFILHPTRGQFADFIQTYVPGGYEGSFNELLNRWQEGNSSMAFSEQAIDYCNQLINLQLNVPTVGASGAVFGVLLAFGMLFAESYVYVFFAIPLKAKYFVAIYALIELYQGFANNPADNVAHFAHLGGMIFGYLLIKYWNRKPIY